MFKDIFGNNPQTKILDFLADHPKYDYSITEISNKADVSRPTVYNVLNILLSKKLIIKTRTLGQSTLYQLNLKNDLVKTMLKFDFEISKKYAELLDDKPIKKYNKSVKKTHTIIKQ